MMHRSLNNLLYTLLILLFPVLSFAQSAKLVPAKKTVKLMGSRFEITAVAESEAQAWQAVEAGIAEISRIERLISSWDPNSQTSLINRMAGSTAVNVDEELFQLIERAKKVAQLTDGAFDISFASMERLYTFDGTERPIPDLAQRETSVALINWQNIETDAATNSVRLAQKGMRIGFGGIGKGYAADKAKAVMAAMEGVHGGLVNAGGDLSAWGKSSNSDFWPVQIANPQNKETALGWLELTDLAIVTSGDYEKFFTSGGKRYAHIINPQTGLPSTGITSVSIICPNAEFADGLATSVFILGKDEGLRLINYLDQVEGLIITDSGDVLTSTNLNLNYY